MMLPPRLIGYFIFLWGSAVLLVPLCFPLSAFIYSVFMAAGLPSSLSEYARRPDSELWSARAAGTVCMLKPGGDGAEAKANTGDLGAVGTDGIRVNRGRQKDGDRRRGFSNPLRELPFTLH